jgi:hypothetical protein
MGERIHTTVAVAEMRTEMHRLKKISGANGMYQMLYTDGETGTALSVQDSMYERMGQPKTLTVTVTVVPSTR